MDFVGITIFRFDVDGVVRERVKMGLDVSPVQVVSQLEGRKFRRGKSLIRVSPKGASLNAFSDHDLPIIPRSPVLLRGHQPVSRDAILTILSQILKRWRGNRSNLNQLSQFLELVVQDSGLERGELGFRVRWKFAIVSHSCQLWGLLRGYQASVSAVLAE